MRRTAWLLLAIVAAGVLLRSLRLDWQPLWWDEGYSIYFATEPPARMVWLTARDIHPPLYYALLHFWLRDWPVPETARLLSVLFGGLALPVQYWLARKMFPHSRGIAIGALLLLAFSPMHLYYSQEVRMYGLALLLGLLSSLALWHLVHERDAGPARRTLWPALGYLLAGLAGLYTLYYSALLLAGHAAWGFFQLRKRPRDLAALAGAYFIMFLLYLPWLVYAVPQLTGYVGGKVQSDQDTPLGPLAYVEQHLVAFTAGQVRWSAIPAEWLALAPATLAICAIILGLVLQQTLRPGVRGQSGSTRPTSNKPMAIPAPDSGSAVSALWTWLLIPVVVGWLINLRLPFFPVGGERLLLIVLPYFLLLLAYAIDRTWNIAHLGKLAAAAMTINAAIGIAAFYTTPRYVADDYRPLIRQVLQQGSQDDVLLAIFPWQVGYWRAYTALGGLAQPSTPAPLLLSDGAVAWSPELEAVVDQALEAGSLWFPEPLTFGSSLPHEIEQYLSRSAVNLENRWYDATRLTAWNTLPPPGTTPLSADFGGVLQLAAGGIGAQSAASANDPVAVTLVWHGSEGSPGAAGDTENSGSEANISLRLQDASGYVWSSREMARSLPAPGTTLTDTVGLIVPYGLPPGGYQVAVSVQAADGQALTITGSDAAAAVIGNLEVTPPDPSRASQSRWRLPIQHALEQPARFDGLELLGHTGPDESAPLPAGTDLAATLFYANRSSAPPQSDIYLSLLDSAGAGVAGYEGWPLPGYPTAAWPEGALVQAPTIFNLPGSLTSGTYRLVTGFIDPTTRAKSPSVQIGTIAVQQRAASFERPTPQTALDVPPQLGTHARLLGYDLTVEQDQTVVKLYWEVLQPLLPPHHIFVHVDEPGGANGAIGAIGLPVAQQDGPPISAGGPAPTGSWQPGEFLVTTHTLPAGPAGDQMLRVGLYDPKTQVRLPVTIDGEPAGDSVILR